MVEEIRNGGQNFKSSNENNTDRSVVVEPTGTTNQGETVNRNLFIQMSQDKVSWGNPSWVALEPVLARDKHVPARRPHRDNTTRARDAKLSDV